MDRELLNEYYDSDEDVYWGPVTLKERKKNLFRPVLVENIERRRTIDCDPSFRAETNKRAENIVEMNKEQPPQKPRRSSFPKDVAEPGFIEKLAQVLDLTTDGSSYHTALDYEKTTTLDDTKGTSDIFESAPTSILLENIQCTLYDSAHFRTLPAHENSKIDESTSRFLEADDVITVSDSDVEVDATFDSQLEVMSLRLVKEELDRSVSDLATDNLVSVSDSDNNLTFDNRLSDDDCSSDCVNEAMTPRHVKGEVMFDRSANAPAMDSLISVSDSDGDGNSTFDDGKVMSPECVEDVSAASNQREIKSSVSDAGQLLSEDSLEDGNSANANLSGYDSDTSNNPTDICHPPQIRIYDYSNIDHRLTNVAGNLDIIEEVDDEYDSTRKFEIFSSSKRVQNTSVDDVIEEKEEKSAGESPLQFNDTLEEMERFLNQGLNYTMEEDKKKSEIEKHVEIPLIKKNVTPIRNIGITVKSARKVTPFKSPVVFHTPSTLPKVSKNKFKNIQSPVATYIKNAGTTPLFEKVTPSKELHRIPVRMNGKANQENNNPEFPEVRYKPAKKKMLTKEEFKLPSCIDSLIPRKATVIKHKARIGNTPSKVHVLDGDLTVNCDSTLNTTDDVSILVSKNAMIL